MGGRGTYAAGNNVAYTYQIVDIIEGVKVLSGLNGKHNLPEEAHSSRAYIKLDHNGVFKMYREYRNDKTLALEIAYHEERKLAPANIKVLHYHTYDKNFGRSDATPLTREMYEEYKKYFRGVKI